MTTPAAAPGTSQGAHTRAATGLRYQDAGVDVEAGNEAVRRMRAAVEATHGPEVLAGVGAFGGLFALGGLHEPSPVLVASTDGVGTKTRIAAALGRYDSIGADLVHHCIDDILVQGARPLFFLDYVATAKLDPGRIATVVHGVARACKEWGVALLGGETAEMPGVYVDGELDLAGTIVGVVDRAAIVDGTAIAPGDVVLGIGSTGLHTNGYSLARHIVAGEDLGSPREALDGRSLGDALLAEHACYLPEFARLQRGAPELGLAGVRVRGLVHITGGGLIDNPPRILPDEVAMWLDESTWTAPPIFAWLAERGGVARSEQRRAFNCGLGLLVVVPAADADRAMALLGDVPRPGGQRLPAFRVGGIEPRAGGAPVRFVGDGDGGPAGPAPRKEPA